MTAESIPDRREFTAKISVGLLIHDSSASYTLLVKNRETQKYTIPAGGLRVLDDEVPETVHEIAERELMEEAGINMHDPNIWLISPLIVGLINLPRKGKIHSFGVIFRGHMKYNASAPYLYPLTFAPTDTDEVDSMGFFRISEIQNMIASDQIHRPYINTGVLEWSFRNPAYFANITSTFFKDLQEPLNEKSLTTHR